LCPCSILLVWPLEIHMENGVQKKYVILNACEEFIFFASASMLIGHFKVKLKKM